MDEVLGNLDDLKNDLYALVVSGELDENTNDQAQELLREVRDLLED